MPPVKSCSEVYIQPPPLEGVIEGIKSHRPAMVFAPHVETSSGIILPDDYIRRVRDTSDPRIVMPGAIYGLGYRELGSWCFAYIHATEVGGTHPALIEAMGRGALVIYRAVEENVEVCGDTGLAFDDEAERSFGRFLPLGRIKRGRAARSLQRTATTFSERRARNVLVW